MFKFANFEQINEAYFQQMKLTIYHFYFLLVFGVSNPWIESNFLRFC